MSVTIPSLRGAIAVPGWAKNELWRKARALPSLDLRFADSKSLVDARTGQSLVTFTRASSGTFVGSDGVIATAATDVPRFDHNPTTGESLGLLVEEQRTNSVTNNTMVGAVAGTPGTLPTGWGTFVAPTGLARAIVGSGTVNGINYIDVRFNGTPSSTGEITLYLSPATTATLAQAWTSTAWLSIAGGSTSNIAGISLRNFEINSGAYVRETNTNYVSSISSDFVRRQNITTSFGASANQIQLVLSLFATAGGTPIDITLRIGLPQLEQGAFATSVIPTTTAAATRSADVASITGSAFSGWYSQSEGTFWVEAVGGPIASGAFPILFVTEGTTSAERAQIVRYSDGRARPSITAGGAGQAAFDLLPAWAQGSIGKATISIKTNDIAGSANGGAVVTDNTATMPALTQLAIGATLANAQHYNGHIRRLVYFPARLANSTLQTLTQ